MVLFVIIISVIVIGGVVFLISRIRNKKANSIVEVEDIIMPSPIGDVTVHKNNDGKMKISMTKDGVSYTFFVVDNKIVKGMTDNGIDVSYAEMGER